MSNYRFELEKYKGLQSRFTCPHCYKPHRFVRYIDTTTGQYLSDYVGKCDRLNECGYHYTPAMYFKDNPNNSISTSKPIQDFTLLKPHKTIPTSFIPHKHFNSTVLFSENAAEIASTNNYVKFLLSIFGEEITKSIIKQYFIGTSIYLPEKTIFWQIDKNFDIRTGKIMHYNAETGNRIKNTGRAFSWIHTKLNKKDFNLKQCFFGEHLLSLPENNHKIVAIVESEKTATIASIYFPNMVWLATGGIHNLQKEKCDVLKKRKVILYPDLNAFELWSEKAKELKSIVSAIKVSNVLEINASESEKKSGLDLADYLIKFNYKEFVADKSFYSLDNQQINSEPSISSVTNNNCTWDIESITQFYNQYKLPDGPIKLDNAQTIINTSKFVEAELTIVEENQNNPTYKPHYDRLCLLKEILEKEIIVLN
ncbi:MAG TPA: DUF6371 domain-containing protein [Bacteroidales bacterium]|nr:DUF6371 domain-containing protein [Bacteroidales bacterium]